MRTKAGFLGALSCGIAWMASGSACSTFGEDASGPAEDPPDAATGATDGGEGGSVLDRSLDGPAEDGAGALPRVVFVTSTLTSGAFGGIGGGDAKCQALAKMSSKTEVASKSFFAWLSDETTGASTRFAREPRTIIRPDGQVVAAALGDLVDGTLEASISLDENAMPISTNNGVWTGTTPVGAPSSIHCGDWRGSNDGTVGSAGSLNGAWTASGVEACSAKVNRLYCFEK